MCCTTFLYESELNIPTSNKELNSILKAVKELTPDNWQVIERVYEQPHGLFSRGKQIKKSYELYKYVGGCGPWQVINFYHDASDTSINLSNSAALVIAFLYGMLAGLHAPEMKNAD